MDFEEKKNLFKIRKTVLEMLEDRKYNIPKNEIIDFDEFSIKYNSKNIDIFIDSGSEELGKMYVYFHNENKSLSKVELKNKINKLIEQYEDENLKIIILLKEKGIGSILKEVNKDEYKNIEIFLNKNMIFNITHHQLVPKHIVLNDDEIKELLEKYSTTINKLPKLLRSDPIAKYYGMKINQVCKIIRKSPEVGNYPYYRLVK
jgi:DNA-directed RNA polymerases I, II, and III subunit RPABC1